MSDNDEAKVDSKEQLYSIILSYERDRTKSEAKFKAKFRSDTDELNQIFNTLISNALNSDLTASSVKIARSDLNSLIAGKTMPQSYRNKTINELFKMFWQYVDDKLIPLGFQIRAASSPTARPDVSLDSTTFELVAPKHIKWSKQNRYHTD